MLFDHTATLRRVVDPFDPADPSQMNGLLAAARGLQLQSVQPATAPSNRAPFEHGDRVNDPGFRSRLNWGRSLFACRWRLLSPNKPGTIALALVRAQVTSCGKQGNNANLSYLR